MIFGLVMNSFKGFPMSILSFQLGNLFCRRHLESLLKMGPQLLKFYGYIFQHVPLILNSLAHFSLNSRQFCTNGYLYLQESSYATLYWLLLWARVSQRNDIYSPSLVDSWWRLLHSNFLGICSPFFASVV